MSFYPEQQSGVTMEPVGEGWQPIETAPEETEVLCWVVSRGGVYSCCQLLTLSPPHGWLDQSGSLIHPAYEPAHWMPLPEPPQ